MFLLKNIIDVGPKTLNKKIKWKLKQSLVGEMTSESKKRNGEGVFFKFGTLEILADGQTKDQILVAKSDGERYYIRERGTTLPKGIYQMTLGELKDFALKRARIKYDSVDVIEVRDKTYRSKERQEVY